MLSHDLERPKYLRPARALAIVAVALCGTALVTSLHLRSLAAAASMAPTADEVATTLVRVGLGPEELAAAGASANDTEAVVQAVLGWMIEEHNQLAAADLAFASAKREHDAVTYSLSGTQRVTLSQIRANEAWSQPTPYLTVARPQEQWVALRDALANERISAEGGEAVEDGAAELLEQARSDSAVMANVETNLALITATWESEIGL